jgi:hypothetical protein
MEMNGLGSFNTEILPKPKGARDVIIQKATLFACISIFTKSPFCIMTSLAPFGFGRISVLNEIYSAKYNGYKWMEMNGLGSFNTEILPKPKGARDVINYFQTISRSTLVPH